ncbi:hypothetical protein LJR234_000008 [Mesorhizobium amorphae]|uniref:nitrilase-related carbon-nitrogen hydrolase n=1 Tax=Mesorhizobium amorphae TaxID=71433 RepID=UPI003ECE1755
MHAVLEWNFLFPELSLCGHAGGRDALALSLKLDGQAILSLAEAAGPMMVGFGLVEERDGAQFYNTQVFVTGGAVHHVHRKVNLATYGKLQDGKYFAAGTSVDTFDLKAPWRGAGLIYNDAWNPGLSYLAGIFGATMLAIPVSSAIEAVGDGFDNPSAWNVNLTFLSLTYGMPLVMANRIGQEDGLTFWGGSRVLNAAGQTEAVADSDDERLVVAELDYSEVRRSRFLLPVIRDANPRLILSELQRRNTGSVHR